ncbi:hypothetical protein PTTG_27622 [Puccinia triticina 1-1 BBBD Race 1]|uniref:Uncharacterized protein n=1 Tax=Puccinia triticina (isolate 1-1 / race 1 (BBBD)) TaxID=630390 RepID=A0A180GJ96_PUCT1|nr:hypothetical protein PTTG_27622 [Puccinia triticina 1-1 BBBD Race 1]
MSDEAQGQIHPRSQRPPVDCLGVGLETNRVHIQNRSAFFTLPSNAHAHGPLPSARTEVAGRGRPSAGSLQKDIPGGSQSEGLGLKLGARAHRLPGLPTPIRHSSNFHPPKTYKYYHQLPPNGRERHPSTRSHRIKAMKSRRWKKGDLDQRQQWTGMTWVRLRGMTWMQLRQDHLPLPTTVLPSLKLLLPSRKFARLTLLISCPKLSNRLPSPKLASLTLLITRPELSDRFACPYPNISGSIAASDTAFQTSSLTCLDRNLISVFYYYLLIMKRFRNNDETETAWQDPNQLAIPALRQALTTFGICLEEGEYRSKLFQRYVKLARIESPESVERWLELDSLDAPLPAAKQLQVAKLKIILALHSVNYPAQASRGHLVKLYNALKNELNPSGSVIEVSTTLPSRSDHKKKKKSAQATHEESLPLPTPPTPTDTRFPTHVGKTRRTKSAAREDTFFQPYRSPDRPARSLVCLSSQTSIVCNSPRTSRRSLSQAAKSSSGSYSLRRSPRLRAAQEEMERASRASGPPSQSSDARDQTLISVKEESDDDDESQTPTHVTRSPLPTRSPTPGPSSSEGPHYQSTVNSASSEAGDSEASSDPRSQSVDGRLACEPGDSGRTASEAPSEPHSQSFKGHHLSEASSDPCSQSASESSRGPRVTASPTQQPSSSHNYSPALAAPLQAQDSQARLAFRADPSPPPTSAGTRQALKRKLEDPTEWPGESCPFSLYHSQLSREQIEEYLDQHNVAYNSTTRIARLIGSYNLLRSSLPELSKPRGSKRPKDSQSHSRSTSRSRLPHSRPCPSSTRKNRRRVGTRSQPKENDRGFVYSRLEAPSSPRTEASFLGPALSRADSPALSSTYQPSVVSTQSSEAHSSRVSVSARSTSASREFPTSNTRRKQAKKNGTQTQAGKKPGRPRARPSQRRQWRRPSSTHHEGNRDVNFVPFLPDASKKRNKRHDDLSSSSSRIKRTRPGHVTHELGQPQSDLDYQLPKLHESDSPSSASRVLCQRNQSANHSPRLVHTKRPRPCLDRFVSPPAHPHASTSENHSFIQLAHPDHFSSPPTNTYTSTSRGRKRNIIPDDKSQSESQPGDNRAPQRKRKQPHHPFSSPQRTKRQATPVSRRVPTSAEVRRRRQRKQQSEDRARRGSLQIHPSLRDNEVIMPSHHPSASGIQGWRASLPRDLSGPQESVASSGTVLPPTPDQTNSGRVTGCCAGQQLVSQLTEASGILAQCLDRVSLSQLRPSSSGEPSSSSDPRPSGSGGPRNLNGPRDLTLLASASHFNMNLYCARVRLHIKTLFGKCMAMNQFPPPVTEREKANWKNEDLDNEDSDDESTASSASLASDYDPRFPYPNGPGHQKASPAILSIMWRTMRRVGVVSFRPDLARSHLDADNAFLWDLAHKIFFKLVQAQEYKDIDLEYCSAAKIHDAINSHAKQIHRTYREAAWAPQRLDQRAILKRRQARTNRVSV